MNGSKGGVGHTQVSNGGFSGGGAATTYPGGGGGFSGGGTGSFGRTSPENYEGVRRGDGKVIIRLIK